MRAYFGRVASWLSQGVNCILLGGHHDQTLASRAYSGRSKPGWRHVYRLLNALSPWSDDHCRDAFVDDIIYARQIIFDNPPVKAPETEPIRNESM